MGVAHLANWQSGRGARSAGRVARAAMMERVARKIFSADALGLILVLIALQAFVFGISVSLRSSDERPTAYFYWAGLCAVLFARAFSKRKLSGFYASVVLIVIGSLGVWVLGARLASPL